MGPLTLGVIRRSWQGAGREPKGDAGELPAPLLSRQAELHKSNVSELAGANLFASNPLKPLEGGWSAREVSDVLWTEVYC